jgi:hypothetical protein
MRTVIGAITRVVRFLRWLASSETLPSEPLPSELLPSELQPPASDASEPQRGAHGLLAFLVRPDRLPPATDEPARDHRRATTESRRTGFVSRLLRAEHLPLDPVPATAPVTERRGENPLTQLLRPEVLPFEGPAGAPARQRPGLLAFLLRPETMPGAPRDDVEPVPGKRSGFLRALLAREHLAPDSPSSTRSPTTES